MKHFYTLLAFLMTLTLMAKSPSLRSDEPLLNTAPDPIYKLPPFPPDVTPKHPSSIVPHPQADKGLSDADGQASSGATSNIQNKVKQTDSREPQRNTSPAE